MKEYKQLGAYGLVILDGRILLIKNQVGHTIKNSTYQEEQ